MNDKTDSPDIEEVCKQLCAMHHDDHYRSFYHTFIVTQQVPALIKCSRTIADRLACGNKILVCGNGGSAADAQHFAAELVGHFHKERRPLPCIALTTDTSALTAIGNDYHFDAIFARQIEALIQNGDVVIFISTSGKSPNILQAARLVLLELPNIRNESYYAVSLTGNTNNQLASLLNNAHPERNHTLIASSSMTWHIQEIHIVMLHLLCRLIEARLT